MTAPAVSPTIRALSPAQAHAAVPALSDILVDCVAGGASVSFMADLDPAKAEAFWRGVADGVARGDRMLLVAEEPGTHALIGTVQVVFATPDNQPHRADVAKMLVHRRARRSGIGAALLRAVDEHALSAGRTVLVLDTVTGGDAERLYARAGWMKVGTIPDYALFPDGRPCATTVFFKHLGNSAIATS